MDNGLTHSDVLYRSIGKVVVAFQCTERILSDVLSSHIRTGGPHRCDIIMGTLSFGQKVDLYSALLRIDATDDRKNYIDAICSYLKTAEEYRNKIVHSDYYVVTGGKSIRWVQKKVSVKGSKGLKMQRKIVNPHEIEKCAAVISDLSFSIGTHLFPIQFRHEHGIQITEATKRLRASLTKFESRRSSPIIP